AWWKAYKQDKGGDVWLITVTWSEFKELFFIQFFPRAEQEPAAGTAEEQAKNFQWRLRKSTLNHLMCIPFTDSSHRNHGHNNDRHGSDRRGGGDNHCNSPKLGRSGILSPGRVTS
nr:hypothetical protein [Tanacetum cinerariifolium]